MTHSAVVSAGGCGAEVKGSNPVHQFYLLIALARSS